MPIADLPALRLSYEQAGQGSPVLLIMGLGVPGVAWAHQVEALAEHHRVTWFDNRGVGASSLPPRPWSTRDMAGDAVALLDHLGVEAAHVAGVSMGGMIAQELALGWRERVRSLTLIATHAGGHRARLPRAAGLWHFVWAQRGRRRRQHLERLLFPSEFLAGCDRQWLDHVLGRDFGRPPSRVARRAQLGAVMGHDTRGRLGALAGLPTLVVSPGRDILVRPRYTRALGRRIPGARLVEIAEAGHGVIRQSADRLNGLLLAHFAEAEEGRS